MKKAPYLQGRFWLLVYLSVLLFVVALSGLTLLTHNREKRHTKYSNKHDRLIKPTKNRIVIAKRHQNQIDTDTGYTQASLINVKTNKSVMLPLSSRIAENASKQPISSLQTDKQNTHATGAHTPTVKDNHAIFFSNRFGFGGYHDSTLGFIAKATAASYIVNTANAFAVEVNGGPNIARKQQPMV